MGTPAFAVPALRAVAEVAQVVTVVTQPDRPRGRGQAMAPSAVAEAATELGLPVMKPERVNDAIAVGAIGALCPDLFAVVAFGAILSPDLLALPRLGALNLHGSLLPDYRGASPVQRALWDGRTSTGVTTLWMDEGIDTGDIVLQRPAPIEPDDDAGILAARLADLGGPLLAETVVLAHEGRSPRTPQDRAQGSYARKLSKQDGAVDWSLDAEVVWNHQRAVTPWPGAWTRFRDRNLILTRTRPLAGPTAGEPGAVLEVRHDGVVVACAAGALLVERVKPEGRAEQAAADWAHGARLIPNERLLVAREAHT